MHAPNPCREPRLLPFVSLPTSSCTHLTVALDLRDRHSFLCAFCFLVHLPASRTRLSLLQGSLHTPFLLIAVSPFAPLHCTLSALRHSLDSAKHSRLEAPFICCTGQPLHFPLSNTQSTPSIYFPPARPIEIPVLESTIIQKPNCQDTTAQPSHLSIIYIFT